MKAWMFIPLALLLGLLLGGLGPRIDARRLRAEIKETRELLARRGGEGRASGMNDITGLLGIETGHRKDERARQKTSTPVRPAPETSDSEMQPIDGTPEDATESAPHTVAAGASIGNEPDATSAAESMAADIESAAELWRARSDVAFATFVDNAGFSDADANQFQVLTTAMNLRIGHTISNFVENVRGAEVVQPEAGIRLANEILDSIVLTYDEMDQSLPGGWRGNAGEAFSLTDFIDPSVALPLSEVKNVFSPAAGD